MANVIKQGRAKTIAPIAAAWAVVFTGFVVTVVNSWGPLYRWNLFLHPALGLLTFVPLILYLRRSLRSRGLPISPRLWIDGPGAAAIVGPLILIPLPSRGVAFALFSALLLYLIVGNILLVVRSEDRRRLPAALSTSLSLGAWALLTFTGLAILILARSGGMTSLFLTHRAMALCFVVVFSTLAFSAATGLHGKASASGAVRRGSGPALAAGAVTLGLLGVVALIDRVHRDPAFEVHLSTIPIEDRTPEEQTMFFADPAFPPAGIDLTVSCTDGPGCHGQLKRGFLESNHNISMMTPHFQKNMVLLTEEIGEENTLICAGCHFPGALFDRALSYRDFRDRNNLSCSFCHIIGDVTINPRDNRRSTFTVAPPVRHLKLFLEDGEERTLDRWTAAQIKLSPLTHGRAFTKPFYKEDVYCVACHHHQILLNPAEGLARPKCIDCHMQPQEQIGLEGPLRNHFMPGANLTVPFFAGRRDAVGIIRDWIEGRFLLAVPGWENLYTLRQGLDDEPDRATWLAMVFESVTPAVPGEVFTLRILTTNAGMEHAFPAAPLDLIEAWLEIRVADDGGRTIFRSGALGEDGRIDPDAHKIGGYMIGMDDLMVKKNRVWQIKKKIVERVIPQGHHIEDRFSFALPADLTGTLTVEGGWNYRKLNQEFMEWAYGRGTHAPVVRVGAFEGRIDVEPPRARGQEG